MKRCAVSTGPNKKPLSILLFVLILYSIKSLVWLAAFPIFQTPDENRHYDYILHLTKLHHFPLVSSKVDRGDLPMQETIDLQKFASFDRLVYKPAHKTTWFFSDDSLKTALANYQETDLMSEQPDFENILLYSYPPLYYLLGSGAYRIARAAGLNIAERFYAVRLLSLIMGLVSLVLIHRIAVILKIPTFVRLFMLLFVVLWPQLSMFMVSVQPDVLAMLLILVISWLIVKSDPHNFPYLTLAVSLGLLGLTKYHYFAALFVGVYAISVWQSRLDHRKIKVNKLVGSMAISTGFCLIWIVHNLAGYRALHPFDGFLGGPDNSLPHRIKLYFLLFKGLFRESYVARLGWLDIRVAELVYHLFWVVVLVGLFSAIVLAAGKIKRSDFRSLLGKEPYLFNYLYLFVPFVVFIGLMVSASLLLTPLLNFQGRYYFPFVMPQVILFIYFPWKAIKKKNLATVYSVLIAIFMFVIQIYSLWTVVERYYG